MCYVPIVLDRIKSHLLILIHQKIMLEYSIKDNKHTEGNRIL